MKYKRIFLIVLDSFGIGELPDADAFSDEGSNTLRAVYSSGKLNVPNLTRLGLFNIDGVRCAEPHDLPIASYGRSSEMSNGKDTTVGHWEIAGVISENPLPTYENGFPEHILNELEKLTGYGWLCNKAYSGTQVLIDYGADQKNTKKMIVYTSADSVFQVAANVDYIPLSDLYVYCEKAREILKGENAVGRVIARPYIGEYPDYVRTSDRHDYSLEPPSKTLLNVLCENGIDTHCVGKISDIFAGSGVFRSFKTQSNTHGMSVTSDLIQENNTGLIFVNLVDFDSKYGHRNDVDGYAYALNEFDAWLGGFIEQIHDEDLLIITADHGCDPSTVSTDHSREYTPILVYGRNILPTNLNTRSTFADIAKTICDNFEIKNDLCGQSFLKSVLPIDANYLMEKAIVARERAYSPYSHYSVGAALLCDDGEVVLGCNVESATFSPTSCAERSALAGAISQGKKDFVAIAIAGGLDGSLQGGCTPCGVCRQMLYELGGKDLLVITYDKKMNLVVNRMENLLPYAFSDENVK